MISKAGTIGRHPPPDNVMRVLGGLKMDGEMDGVKDGLPDPRVDEDRRTPTNTPIDGTEHEGDMAKMRTSSTSPGMLILAMEWGEGEVRIITLVMILTSEIPRKPVGDTEEARHLHMIRLSIQVDRRCDTIDGFFLPKLTTKRKGN